MGDTTPFDFFRQEASHQDVVVRAEAMNKLLVILSLMTPEKVRADMVPYLTQAKTEDLDLVLLNMSKRLGDFIPYIGGPQHAKILVPLLENLLNVEETEVRKAAGTSAVKILKALGPEHKVVTKEFLDMFNRLVIDDGGEVFYGRVSACHIAPQLFKTLNDIADKVSVKDAFAKLAVDELSIIRRAAAAALIEFTRHAEKDQKLGDCLTMLKHFAADESSSVKIMGVELLAPFAKILNEIDALDAISKDILPLVKAAAEDPSWRVKGAIAKQYGTFAGVFPQDQVLPFYRCGLTLMTDDEPDVRQQIIVNMLPYAQPVGLEIFMGGLIPVIQLLFDDPVPEVRRGIADLCVDVAALAGPDGVVHHVGDLILKLLADEDGLVRLRILQKLPAIAEGVPPLFNRLTPHVKSLFADNSWRVRKAIILSMPRIISHMGQQFFQDNFMNEYLLTLKDSVSEVRLAVGESIPQIYQATTSEWFFQHIFPSMRNLTRDEYLIRQCILQGLCNMLRPGACPCFLSTTTTSTLDVHSEFVAHTLAGSNGSNGMFPVKNTLSEQHQVEVLSLITGAGKDAVMNIRLIVAQILGLIYGDINSLVSENNKNQLIRGTLNELQSDKDPDVKYFASTALLKKL